MNGERVDEVSSHYELPSKIDSWCGYLFYISAVNSLALIFHDLYGANIELFLKMTFAIMTVALLSLFLYSKFFLIPKAERSRRKQLLSNSLGTTLTSELTQNYYNNPISPSVLRLAANTMENAFFTKSVSGKMLITIRIKSILYILVWLALAFYRSTPMDTVIWITQLLFSFDVLAYWWSVEFLRVKSERVFDDLYNHFLHKHGDTQVAEQATILDSFAEYESAKATSGIILDSKLFFKENEAMSAEWTKIKACINLIGSAEETQST